MPILLIVILAIIIAQVDFWNTLQAILGAVARVVLLALLIAAARALGVYMPDRVVDTCGPGRSVCGSTTR